MATKSHSPATLNSSSSSSISSLHTRCILLLFIMAELKAYSMSCQTGRHLTLHYLVRCLCSLPDQLLTHACMMRKTDLPLTRSDSSLTSTAASCCIHRNSTRRRGSLFATWCCERSQLSPQDVVQHHGCILVQDYALEGFDGARRMKQIVACMHAFIRF